MNSLSRSIDVNFSFAAMICVGLNCGEWLSAETSERKDIDVEPLSIARFVSRGNQILRRENHSLSSEHCYQALVIFMTVVFFIVA
jgi:hypothetical protein